MSRAPRDELAAYQQRMGWNQLRWYSSFANTFNRDFGLTMDRGEIFSLRCYLRDGDDVFLTYATSSRGVDRLRFDFDVLDLTAFGRQETWEDSPAGWPQTEPYRWWRRSDEYEGAIRRARPRQASASTCADTVTSIFRPGTRIACTVVRVGRGSAKSFS
jgi:predicted dithiol-disulfide oxidoreductase (DUF899 family)